MKLGAQAVELVAASQIGTAIGRKHVVENSQVAGHARSQVHVRARREIKRPAARMFEVQKPQDGVVVGQMRNVH